MKMKYLWVLSAIIVTISFFFPFSKNSFADTNPWQEMLDAFDQEYDLVVEIYDVSENVEQFTLAQIQAKIATWRSILNKTNRVFQYHASSSDLKAASIAKEALSNNEIALESVGYMDKMLSSDSDADMQKYGDLADSKLTQYIDKRDKLVDVFNEQSGANEYQSYNNLYKWGSIISGILSLFLWIKSRNRSTISAEILRSHIYLDLFKHSLWMFIGFIITYVTFTMADSGGSYFIFYGPVIYGLWDFSKGLFKYLTVGRKALNKISTSEKYEIYQNTFDKLDKDAKK